MRFVKFNAITLSAMPALHKHFTQCELRMHRTQRKTPGPCVKFNTTHASEFARRQ